MRTIINIFAILLAFICGIFSALFNFLFPDVSVQKIRENLDMHIKPYYVEYHEDNRGWFGDGEEIIIFTPNPEQAEKIKSEWNKTPVNSRIYSLIFSKTEYNGLELAKHIPNAKGYWFYKNRSESASGHSQNFSFALYDGEHVYYYELDT